MLTGNGVNKLGNAQPNLQAVNTNTYTNTYASFAPSSVRPVAACALPLSYLAVLLYAVDVGVLIPAQLAAKLSIRQANGS